MSIFNGSIEVNCVFAMKLHYIAIIDSVCEKKTNKKYYKYIQIYSKFYFLNKLALRLKSGKSLNALVRFITNEMLSNGFVAYSTSISSNMPFIKKTFIVLVRLLDVVCFSSYSHLALIVAGAK